MNILLLWETIMYTHVYEDDPRFYVTVIQNNESI